VVRDLHDGAQQRLVHAIVMLQLAQRAVQTNDETAESLIGEALEQAREGNRELRELAHGILPSVLLHGGLSAGVDALVSRSSVPVTVSISGGQFSPEVEATAYFVVAEALTNVAKHSQAQSAEVRVQVEDGALLIEVRDDGVGGADARGSGLLGLADRIAVLDGDLKVESPQGGGTRVTAAIPVPHGQ
jgi:signal transduction histidine kinase